MATRAKFKVISHLLTQTGVTVNLQAVTGGSKENESFFKWTPSATISLSLLSPETALEFPFDAEVYCDFTLAPKA